MKPHIRISLDVEDHDLPQPGDVEIGQNIICPDWPLLAAKLEQIALLLRDKARA